MWRWIVGGLVGGLIGAIIWALIVYFAQMEIGWIAIGIGFLAGIGVRFGVAAGDDDDSFVQGGIAAAAAVGAILLAKYIVYLVIVSSIDYNAIDEVEAAARDLRYDDEAMISELADEIAIEREESGQELAWPDGMDLEKAAREADYPSRIWDQAERQWTQTPEKERESKKLQRMMLRSELMSLTHSSRADLSDFFSPWDFLWCGLAILTALRVGSGVVTDD